MKLKDIAPLLSVGKAELDRAVAKELLTVTLKEDGHDSGAFMLRLADLVRYLKIREAVIERGMVKPDWWDDVIKPGGRRKDASGTSDTLTAADPPAAVNASP